MPSYSNTSFSLSVLDQSPVPEGSTAGDALRNSIDLARFTDTLGYHRYWIAEHHASPGVASASPEVLIGPIAQSTSRLHVGSGGVMLPHYSPLKVAETFSMLSGLYPGRIDLGIGRAAGTTPAVSIALQRNRSVRPPDDFIEQLQELLSYFENSKPLPIRFASPEPWLLGSSPQSAIWAAELGLPYCFADFINPDGVAIAAHYRYLFTPSERHKTAKTAVAAWAICADTDEEALRLSVSFRMMMTLMFRGRLISVPTIERAEQFLKEEGVSPSDLPVGRRLIIGSPATVRAALESLAREYRAEEVFLVNIVHSHQARRRSYELIAQEFGLARQQEHPPAQLCRA